MPHHVWVTRTEPGASREAEAIAERGHQVWCEPVIEIENLAVAVPTDEPDVVITLSGHAARRAATLGLTERSGAALHVAIGAETARLLAAADVQALIPGEASSEGVRAMPEMQSLPAGAIVWLWAGRGGRDLLARTLTEARGCSVVKFELYLRRRKAPINLPAAPITAVVASSVEGLQAFADAWQQAGGGYNVGLVAVSSRVAAEAQALGFTRVVESNGADAAAVCAAIEALDVS